MKYKFEFSKAEKAGMMAVLRKYKTAPDHHAEVCNSLNVDGWTCLFLDEALYLSGIVQMYYPHLARRLRSIEFMLT